MSALQHATQMSALQVVANAAMLHLKHWDGGPNLGQIDWCEHRPEHVYHTGKHYVSVFDKEMLNYQQTKGKITDNAK